MARHTLSVNKQLERLMETYDPKKNTTDVRQASPRKMNSRVLVFSMVGVIVLLVIVYAVFTMNQPNPT